MNYRVRPRADGRGEDLDRTHPFKYRVDYIRPQCQIGGARTAIQSSSSQLMALDLAAALIAAGLGRATLDGTRADWCPTSAAGTR